MSDGASYEPIRRFELCDDGSIRCTRIDFLRRPGCPVVCFEVGTMQRVETAVTCEQVYLMTQMQFVELFGLDTLELMRRNKENGCTELEML